MAGVKTEDGVVHVPSDGYDDVLGVRHAVWFALCDVVAYRPLYEPSRRWKEADFVDEHVTCLECIGHVREALGFEEGIRRLDEQIIKATQLPPEFLGRRK